VSVRAAQDRHLDQLVRLEVGYVPPLPEKEARIFDALYARSDQLSRSFARHAPLRSDIDASRRKAISTKDFSVSYLVIIVSALYDRSGRFC
jgi:hypothetical protein